jgi:hypothetical protein
MATYTPILDTQLDPDAPLTSSLMYQLRDNFLSAAEGDTSVPLAVQLGHRLLGTLTTTSGTTVTLSGLDLTKFRFLKCVFNGVSFAGAGSQNFGIGGVVAFEVAASSDTICGVVELDLFNGRGGSFGGNPVGASGQARGMASTITTASTSVSVATSPNAFDAGSIRVYGVQ